jgi:hypothetical protein
MLRREGENMKGLQTPHEVAAALVGDYEDTRSLSEADTRHQVIDVILHDVLSWPRSAVLCESYVDPGYADYVLISNADSQLIFIEAKKEGIFFELPLPLLKDDLSSLIKTKTLMTDPAISKAITQVRNYCVDTGCELGGVTNGHQWIFFKTFERHSDWRNLHAFVVKSLRYFSDSFTDAVNTLGFEAVTENAALAQRLGRIEMKRRERSYTKSKIPEYSQEMHNNFLATCIRPLSDRYLGKMNPADDAFMHRCYVNVRDYEASTFGVTQIIKDCLTPYFKNYNVQEFFDDSEGGEFGKRIASHLRERRTREVVILFGGKGAGKSTFIRKLLYHRPPAEIADHSAIAVVDLLECPEDRTQIESETWRQLLGELDQKKLLEADRDTLLALFHDRYTSAKKQILAGLNPTTEAFNIRLNDLVAGWLKDPEYCTQRLADYWKTQQKGTIVVLDNTDQYSPAVQDYCFTLAQHIATLVDGLVVIAMREERFHTSRLHGTLDAFQNNGFHLSSPPPRYVFYRRLAYMLRMLDDKEAARRISPTLTDSRNEEVKSLLRILTGEFRRENSHLSGFLRACSHGNMRLSLEMFRHFLLSGYTKVDEMLKAGNWNLQVHQVLRPMMIPDRFFYDESLSSIPNIYQVRSDITGSHFTGLRVLDLVSENVSPLNPVFIPVARLKAAFANRYKMLDDLYKNLDVMLRKGLLESNNRLDEYSDSVDAVKITPYGFYMRTTLSGMFSYMDLVSVDCSIHEESVAHSLAGMARKELEMFFKGIKGDRIELRLARVEEFIEYLCREAAAERDYYSLDTHEVKYASELQAAFIEERERVRGSARRYIEKQQVQSPDFRTEDV